MAVTILGLGPGGAKFLTLEAQEVLEDAQEVYLRTLEHPGVEWLPEHLTIHSFDHLYQQAETFAEVYQAIAERVLELGRRQAGVVYAVPGHPLVGERSVQLILEGARRKGMEVRLVPGVSFIDSALVVLGVDALDGLQLVDAYELAQRLHPPLDPDTGALVGQLHSQELASEVKLTLLNLYPPEHEVTLVRGAGTPREEIEQLPLYQLDQGVELDLLTCLYIPPLPQESSLATLQDLIARLRAPDGCPWDREQTHLSLRANLLEEAYEVLEALDRENAEALCEELGDLMMQIALHAQIAAEEGEFTLAQVAQCIIAKLRRRHPHVFAGAVVADAAEVLEQWQRLKEEERAEEESALAGVPRSLPALAQAQALQGRAARVGFDWPELEGVIAKVAEEIRELEAAPDAERRERELGDLLFALVNLSRWLGIEAESALRGANDRFRDRFATMERLARERSLKLNGLSLEELDALWEEAKGRGGSECL